MTIDFRGYEPMPQHEVDLEMQRSFERTAAAERERLAHCRAQEAVTEVQDEPCKIQTVEQAKQKMEEMRRNGFRRVMSPEEVELEALLADVFRSMREGDTAPAADKGPIAATDGSELIIIAETDEDPTVAEVGGTPEFSAPSIPPAPTVDVLEPSPVTPGPSVVDHEFPIAHGSAPVAYEAGTPHAGLHHRLGWAGTGEGLKHVREGWRKRLVNVSTIAQKLSRPHRCSMSC